MSYGQYNNNPYSQGPSAESGYGYDQVRSRLCQCCLRIVAAGTRGNNALAVAEAES